MLRFQYFSIVEVKGLELDSKAAYLIVCSTFQALKDNEAAIQQEMIDIQGVPADVGGYYKPDEDKANAVMRPSKVTLVLNIVVSNYFLT